MGGVAFLMSEAASVGLFCLLIWRENLQLRQIYAAYALCDLLFTPGKTMFSLGASTGWDWFVPPFRCTRLTFSGMRKQRAAGLALWTGCLLCLGIFLADGDGRWLTGAFVCYSAFLYEDIAFWRSHLLLHLTYHVLLASEAQFPYALAASMGRLWFMSGFGKLFPEFWASWHPFILRKGSPIYGALVGRMGLPQRALEWHSFIGGCLETCFPLLLLGAAPIRVAGYCLCLAMHAYIILGFFAPMLWNVTAMLVVSHVASASFYDGLAASAFATSFTAYHASELAHVLCWLVSNLGLAFNGFFNSNIHGGNWPTRHIYVRKSAVSRLLGDTADVPPQFRPQPEWLEVVDPWCAVACADTFKMAAPDGASPSDYVRLPLFFIWIRLGCFWNQCVIDDFAQRVAVKHFFAGMDTAQDVAIVEVGPMSWLRRRNLRVLRAV
ncbi:hypothetical protein AB1Y20_022029 [Prymnesium parvum]|uniref:HTTM domain-containing protein n=1 Tax=Prymnesium parvum TaxID=97485 RepID=A0AB34JI64_PRYPA